MNRSFDRQKAAASARRDNSKKGSVDKRMLSVVGLLNGSNDFYTTSSCSGRIMLLVPGRDKRETKWLFVSHDTISGMQQQQLRDILAAAAKKSKKEVWLRQEAMILHVCCRSLDAAKRLLQLSRDAGFRRAGIIALGRRIIIEIVGSAHFETIIAAKGKVVVSDALLRLLAEAANRRLRRNFAMLRRFATESVLGRKFTSLLKQMKIPTTASGGGYRSRVLGFSKL